MHVFQVFSSIYGPIMGPLRLALSPLSLLLTTPWRLLKAFRNALALTDGRWSRYGYQFGATFSVINLWYQKVLINIDRFGRSGTTPYLSTGNFLLSKFVHYSLPVLYMQWHAGPIVPFLGMLGWLALHGLWMLSSPPWMVLAFMGLVGVSTTFYVNIFHRQGYHALAWTFFPMGLYGYLAGSWELSAIAWLLASVFSPTVVFLAMVVTVFESLWTRDPVFLLSVAPAAIKLATHFVILLRSEAGVGGLLFVLNSMSISKKKVRYRHRRPGAWTLLPPEQTAYYALLYGQFLVALWATGNPATGLFIGGVALFLLHAFLVKLVDNQHLYMLNASIGLAAILCAPFDWLTCVSFALCINPLPYFLDFCSNPRALDVVPEAAPFDMTEALGKARDFLEPVAKNARVFVAFDDPQGSYHDLFHGYRLCYELILFEGVKKEVLIYPDTFVPYEEDVDHAFLWGRDRDKVLVNAKRFGADYLALGVPEGAALDPAWGDSGFTALTRFSWREMHALLHEEPIVPQPFEDWWLLRVPQGFQTGRTANGEA